MTTPGGRAARLLALAGSAFLALSLLGLAPTSSASPRAVADPGWVQQPVWQGTITTSWSYSQPSGPQKFHDSGTATYRDLTPLADEGSYGAQIALQGQYLNDMFELGCQERASANFGGAYPAGGDSHALTLSLDADGPYFTPGPIYIDTIYNNVCPTESSTITVSRGWGGVSFDHSHAGHLEEDTDPDPRHLVGTTRWTNANPPGGYHQYGNDRFDTYEFTVTYDLRMVGSTLKAVDDFVREQADAGGGGVTFDPVANDEGREVSLVSLGPVEQVSGPPVKKPLRPLLSEGNAVTVVVPSAKKNGGRPVIGEFAMTYVVRDAAGETDTGRIVLTLFDCANLTTEEHEWGDGASLRWTLGWCFDGTDVDWGDVNGISTDSRTSFDVVMAALGLSGQWSEISPYPMGNGGWRLISGGDISKRPRSQICAGVPGASVKKLLLAAPKKLVTELAKLVLSGALPDSIERTVDDLVRGIDDVTGPKACWTIKEVDVRVSATPQGGVVMSYGHKDRGLFARYTFKLRYDSGGPHPKTLRDGGGFDSPKSASRTAAWGCEPYDKKCKAQFSGPGAVTRR